jgi:predicted DNA-binding transcriptional regulator AlpA
MDVTMSNPITTTQQQLLKELSEHIITTLAENGAVYQAHSQQSNQSEWLNVEELCHYLPDKPCRNTIYKWKNKGIIPYHKRSKQLYFLKSEIDSWLKSKRGKTIDEMKSMVDNKLKSSSFGRVR